MKSNSSIRHRGTIFPGLAISVGLILLVVMLLVLILLESNSTSFPFSTTGYRDWRIVGFTTVQATLSTVISLSVGLTMAWALSHQTHFPGRSALIALLSSALVLPTLVVVLGLVTVFGRNGWLNGIADQVSGQNFGSFIYGITGILVAHVYMNASFSVRSLLNRLEAIPREKRKLVRSLDISTWRRFILLEWPAVKPVMPRLATVIFLLCFTSFAIVLTLGGSPRYNTLEVAIFEAVKLDFDLARALDLALLQLIICAMLVIVSGNFRSGDSQISQVTGDFRWPEPKRIAIIQWSIVFAIGLFFLTPLVAVIIDGFKAELTDLVQEKTFQKAAATSIVLALLSSILTLVFSIAIASASRNFVLNHRMGLMKISGSVSKFLTFSGTLYLAVPSLVMALGFFLLARQAPGTLASWAFVAILTANTLMALPFALAVLLPSMEKLAIRYDRLTFSLDLSRTQRWKFVEWPVLKPDIGYVCAVSFCLSFGDLGVVSLFGSQDFATLPWFLYQKMGSYRTDDAAGVALIMLMMTIFVFFVVPRFFNSTSRSGRRQYVET